MNFQRDQADLFGLLLRNISLYPASEVRWMQDQRKVHHQINRRLDLAKNFELIQIR